MSYEKFMHYGRVALVFSLSCSLVGGAFALYGWFILAAKSAYHFVVYSNIEAQGRIVAIAGGIVSFVILIILFIVWTPYQTRK